MTDTEQQRAAFEAAWQERLTVICYSSTDRRVSLDPEMHARIKAEFKAGWQAAQSRQRESTRAVAEPSFVISKKMVERLCHAVEGECDGLAITVNQALGILRYALTSMPVDYVLHEPDRNFLGGLAANDSLSDRTRASLAAIRDRRVAQDSAVLGSPAAPEDVPVGEVIARPGDIAVIRWKDDDLPPIGTKLYARGGGRGD